MPKLKNSEIAMVQETSEAQTILLVPARISKCIKFKTWIDEYEGLLMKDSPQGEAVHRMTT